MENHFELRLGLNDSTQLSEGRIQSTIETMNQHVAAKLLQVLDLKSSMLNILNVVLIMCLTVSPAAFGASIPAPEYRPDQILIQPKAGISHAALAAFHVTHGASVQRMFAAAGGSQVVTVPAGETVLGLIAEYQHSGLVAFAEPDYFVHASATMPDDPYFSYGLLWGLNNYGQSGGTVGADIDAPAGWDVLTSASNIVVAVLDSGIWATHEDLASNMWVNPHDGGHGFNAFTGTNDPVDDGGHGTLVAGVLGGVGNNGKGVCGVAWQVQMMACKCLTAYGTGTVSSVTACIDYAVTNGARIINASFDSPDSSLTLSNAIVAARDAGVIWVASAGNAKSGTGRDIDFSPSYPSCYRIDNMVSVAYTTRNDDLGFLSNYGATNVDLAAPGDQVYSTINWSDTSYYPPSNVGVSIAGTSFAAPYVSGALALMLAKYPTENYHQIIARLLAATDRMPSLAGKCVTGGRLNLAKALNPPIWLSSVPPATAGSFQLHLSTGANRECVIQASTNLVNWSPVYTNMTSTNGRFDFTNTVGMPSLFYRAVSSL